MLFNDYKNKISKAEPIREVLSQISYEAFKDNDISMKQYDKLVEMCVKREIDAKLQK